MAEKLATIYCITNLVTGKKYIGFDSAYPTRIRKHKTNALTGLKYPLYKAIRKYGWANFSTEILYQSTDHDNCLNKMEPFYIKKFDSFGKKGYNQTAGGEGTLESPRPKTKKWRLNHSKIMKGQKNPRYNYKYTTAEKLAHANRMKQYYKDHPEKILKGNKTSQFGKKRPKKWCENHSKIMKEKFRTHNPWLKQGTCKHCGVTTTIGHLGRYHNDRCKRINTTNTTT